MSPAAQVHVGKRCAYVAAAIIALPQTAVTDVANDLQLQDSVGAMLATVVAKNLACACKTLVCIYISQ